MAAGAPWHKRYHSDALNGMRGLTLEQRGAYSTFTDMLYDSGEEGLVDNERYIAVQMGISARKWRVIRDELIALNKIDVIACGRLSNRRYRKERIEMARLSAKRAAAGQKGGRKSAEQPELFKENNADAEANAKQMLPDAKNDENTCSSRRVHDVFAANSEGFSSTNGRNSSTKSTKPPKQRGGYTRAYQRLDKKEKEIEERSPISFGNAKSKPKAAAKPKKRAIAMPKRWSPKPLTESAAEIVAQWPPGMIERELDRFTDHAEMQGRTVKNWDAAWRNWLRKADDDWKLRERRTGGQSPASNLRGSRPDPALDMLRHALAEEAAERDTEPRG